MWVTIYNAAEPRWLFLGLLFCSAALIYVSAAIYLAEKDPFGKPSKAFTNKIGGVVTIIVLYFAIYAITKGYFEDKDKLANGKYLLAEGVPEMIVKGKTSTFRVAGIDFSIGGQVLNYKVHAIETSGKIKVYYIHHGNEKDRLFENEILRIDVIRSNIKL